MSEDTPERPACLILSAAYEWYHKDRQEVVKYIKHLEADIEHLEKQVEVDMAYIKALEVHP